MLLKSNKDLLSIFPIKKGDIRIDVISKRDIDEYMEIIASDYYNKYNDVKINEKYTKEVIYTTLQELIRHYEIKDNGVEIRVVMKSRGRIIGCAVLMLKRGRVEIGYAIKEEFRGNGYCVIMLNYILNTLRDKFEAMEIQACIQKKNIASIRVVEKLGFIRARKDESRVYYNKLL